MCVCVCVDVCVYTHPLSNNNTGCVNEIVKTTSKEKNRVLKDLEM